MIQGTLKQSHITEELILITNHPLDAQTVATNLIMPAELASITTGIDSLEEANIVMPESFAEALLPLRAKGDQVNSFLFCVLVSKAAKRITLRAEKIGVVLPISTVMRSVLAAYQLAAKDESGPFNESTPDFVGLMKLDEKILRNELVRQALDKVKR
jgi:hypothetical protein